MNYKYNYNKEWVNNNFDIKSFTIKDINLIKHILTDNTLSNPEATPDKELKFKNQNIAGECKNQKDTLAYIENINNTAKGTHKNPFKVIVSTLNLQPQAQENQAIIKKWAEHEIETWKKRGIKVIISGLHLNETSVNLHIIADNSRIKNNELVFGWGFKSINLDKDLQEQKNKYINKMIKSGKKPRTDTFGTFETKQLHREQEKLLEVFCKNNGLTYKQQSTRMTGKNLSIQEYKEIYKQLDSQAVAECNGMIKKLTEQLTKQNNLITSLQKNENEATYLAEIQKRDNIISQLTQIIKNTQTKNRSK